MASLTTPLSSFVGREADIARVCSLLSSTRLLTLTGPGGVGKTRLALAAAASLADTFRDGVAFVSLAAVTDPALVGSAIGTALRLAERGSHAPGDILAGYLADRELLLVLDNFEQIVDAAPLVSDLLHAAPGLRALVTSRVSLRIDGEQECLVQPLALPAPDATASLEHLRAYEAVALFEQRARGSRVDFQLTEGNAAVVAEICRRLDGLPLAIELAAARVKLLAPAALLERLDRRLPLLTGGSRNLPARQQTMRDAIAWSYDLLSPDEQRLLRQLAVFSGGWTLVAAEAICQLDADNLGVFDGLASLADKSLLRQTAHPDGSGVSGRFGMLETIREYGLEQLEQSGEAMAMRDRHADYYTGVAEEAAPHLRVSDGVMWLSVLDAEHSNVLAALDWLLLQQDTERGLRLVGALREVWVSRGRLTEGMTRAEAFLALPGAAARTPARARALMTAAGMALWQHDDAVAIALSEEALSIWEEVGDRSHAPYIYNTLGMASGSYRRTAAPDDERAGYERARVYLERGLSLAREIGDTTNLGYILNNLGIAAQILDELDLSTAHFTEALAVAQSLGDTNMTALVSHGIGRLAYLQGDHLRAATMYRESLRLFHEVGAGWGIALALDKHAIIAHLRHDAARAARLFGAAEALHARIGSPPSVSQRQDQKLAVPAVRAALGETAFDALLGEGRAMSLDQAVAYALEAPATPEPDASGTHKGLTPRELDVLRLVATGLTDAEVAEQLFLSRRTVSSHLTSIYTKLGVSSRAAATRYAVNNGLA
ncbi:MAG TPA: LuxR C-terminal-related transcriptional regulator [Thermomicrobiales bacterium]|nr:LuxR C-terminal-related transcriptional regulator [Thermomicrobiales bacterium]